MKSKVFRHPSVTWVNTKVDVRSRISELQKWRYDRKSSAVTNNTMRDGYDKMETLFTETIPANTDCLIELSDAISESYKQDTEVWKDLREKILGIPQCTEEDWGIIDEQIQLIIREREFLNTLYIDGNGLEGSSWYRKTGWSTLGSALKSRAGVITCPYVITGKTSGVIIIAWRIKILDLGRMFITPYYAKKIYANIPSDIECMSNIEELSFCFNFLMGSIPDGICKLNKLRILKFEANQLSGIIPVGFGKGLKSLEELYLDHNRLEGSIDELLDLPVIKKIHIHENKFYGEMKDAFLNKGLEEFHFYYNYLELSEKILKRCDGDKWDGRKEKEKPMRVVKLSN